MKNCPDCKGELVKGSVIDFTYGGSNASMFAENDNAESKHISSIRNNFRNLRKIIAYRCVSCNRIFQYAGTEVIRNNINTAGVWWVLGLLLLAMFVFLGVMFFSIL